MPGTPRLGPWRDAGFLTSAAARAAEVVSPRRGQGGCWRRTRATQASLPNAPERGGKKGVVFFLIYFLLPMFLPKAEGGIRAG